MAIMNNSYFLWLIWTPLIGAPIVYISGRLCRLTRKCPPILARWAALGVLAVSWVAFWLTWQDFSLSGEHYYFIEAVPMRLDGLSVLVSAVVLALTTLVTLFSAPYMAGETGESKYYAMLVALAGTIIGLACAADLFNLWVWFEAMAVTSYLLVAFYRDEPASLEAGIKYLVQSAIGSVLVLLGIALVLAQTGTLSLAEIRPFLTTSPINLPTMAAMALFVIGFGVKAALVPLHTWLPDAHSQAPSGISAMLSGVVIEAGLVAMLRVMGAVGETAVFSTFLLAFGALNMLVGNLLALRQTQVKRLLAFSSVSHMGYMLLGFGFALNSGQLIGAQGSLFHLLSHSLMKGLAFLAVGALMYGLQGGGEMKSEERRARPHLNTLTPKHAPLTISDMAGAAQKYPYVALAMSLAVLGLGGLPPLVGFMSKWQILTAGFATLNLTMMILVLFAALNSVLSLAYYAPLVNVVYRQHPSAAVAAGRPLPALMTAPILLAALMVVLIGLWPGLVSWLIEPAASFLW